MNGIRKLIGKLPPTIKPSATELAKQTTEAIRALGISSESNLTWVEQVTEKQEKTQETWNKGRSAENNSNYPNFESCFAGTMAPGELGKLLKQRQRQNNEDGNSRTK